MCEATLPAHPAAPAPVSKTYARLGGAGALLVIHLALNAVLSADGIADVFPTFAKRLFVPLG